MTTSGSVAESDRLPWLEPYREPKAAKRRPAARSPRPATAGAAALALLVVAGGAGYWFGQRDAASTPPGATVAPPAASTTVPVQPLTGAAPARPAEAEPNAAPPAEPLPAASSARPAAERTSARRQSPTRRSTPRRKIRSAGVETAQLNAVREQQEGTTAAPVSTTTIPPPAQPQPTSRYWPRLPSPGPAGQVIQLGAFSHPDRAYSAYRTRLSRYPALRRMPRVIVPVVPKAAGGEMLYVLRLGTKSRIQSKSVCRSLKRRGDHCIVIG